MFKRIFSQIERRKIKRSPWVLILLLLVWSGLLGGGMAISLDFNSATAQAQGLTNQLTSQPLTDGTVDPPTERYQLGQELYLQNCSRCHIALPPAVFPTETWRSLLQDRQHYGQQLEPLRSPDIVLVWNYLRTFSREQPTDEPIPYRARGSRYFKALHPKVALPEKVEMSSCIACHPGTNQFNFRRFAPDWENSP